MRRLRISAATSGRKRIADVQHHREANDLGKTVEITAGISHRLRLRNSPSSLKPIYSDNARSMLEWRRQDRRHPLFRRGPRKWGEEFSPQQTGLVLTPRRWKKNGMPGRWHSRMFRAQPDEQCLIRL